MGNFVEVKVGPPEAGKKHKKKKGHPSEEERKDVNNAAPLTAPSKEAYAPANQCSDAQDAVPAMEHAHKKSKKREKEYTAGPAEAVVLAPEPESPPEPPACPTEKRHTKSKKCRDPPEAVTSPPAAVEPSRPAEVTDQHASPTVDPSAPQADRHKKSKKKRHLAEGELQSTTAPEAEPQTQPADDEQQSQHKKSKKRHRSTEAEAAAEAEAVAKPADGGSPKATELAPQPTQAPGEDRPKKPKKRRHMSDDAAAVLTEEPTKPSATETVAKDSSTVVQRSPAPNQSAGAVAVAVEAPRRTASARPPPAVERPPDLCNVATTSVSGTSVLPAPVAMVPTHSPRAVPAPWRAPVPPYTSKAVGPPFNPAPAPSGPRPFTTHPYRPGGPPPGQFRPQQWAGPPQRFMTPAPAAPADFHRRLVDTFPPCPPTLRVLRPIGQGNYARVFEATGEFPAENGTPERRTCTVKQIPATHDWTMCEALRLKEAQGVPHVLRCFGCYYELQRREIWIATERMDGSVLDILLSSFPLPEAMIADIAYQTLQALRGLHKLQLVHMDVKPANILCRRLPGQRTMEFKLGDFGCVQDQRNGEVDELGEFTYMSPEVILHRPRTTSSDLWNLGVTCLHLADGEPPLNGWDDHLRTQLIAHTTLCPQLREPQRWSPDLGDFIAKCLIKDCHFRPDAAALLDHPLFQRHGLKAL
eukprot:EG_transcript_2753